MRRAALLGVALLAAAACAGATSRPRGDSCRISLTASADESFEQAGYDSSPRRLIPLVAATRERFVAAVRRLCAAGELRPADLRHFRRMIVQNGEGATEALIYEDPLRGPDFFVFQFAFQDGGAPEPEQFERALRCWKHPEAERCDPGD